MGKSDELRAILDAVQRSEGLLFFFRNFWKTEASWRRFWLRHPDDFLPTTDYDGVRVTLPYLHYNTALTDLDLVAATIARSESHGDLARARHEAKTQRFVDWFEDFVPVLKRQAILALAYFWRANPQLRELLEAGEVSDDLVARVIGKDPPKLKEPLDAWIQTHDEGIKAAGRAAVAKTMPDLLSLAPALHPGWSNHSLYYSGCDAVVALVRGGNLDPRWYGSMLEQVVGARLVTNDIGSVFACQNCGPEVMSFASPSQLAPSKLDQLACPQCRAPLTAATLYKLGEELTRLVFFEDRLLAIAFALLLESQKIKYESFVPLGNGEADFLIGQPDGILLVECKVHRIPEGERSARGGLEGDLVALRKVGQRLHDQGKRILASYLLTNRMVEEQQSSDQVRIVEMDDVLKGAIVPIASPLERR